MAPNSTEFGRGQSNDDDVSYREVSRSLAELVARIPITNGTNGILPNIPLRVDETYGGTIFGG